MDCATAAAGRPAEIRPVSVAAEAGSAARAGTAARVDTVDPGTAGRRAAARAVERDTEHHMNVLAGKFGLITGVANRRSIAWAVAQVMARDGARLALTYQGERLGENVRELAQELSDPLVIPMDVTADEQMDEAFATIQQEFGGLDFVLHGTAFAPREELSRPFTETSREGFRIALDVSAYSLVAMAKRAAPLMAPRGGGSICTLSYLGADRVFTNYNVMGVAKAALESSVRYLAADLGPQGIRVNAISAGPIKTLAASGISGFSSILQVYRERSPLKRNVELEEVAETGRFLLGPESSAITGEVLLVDAGFHVMGF
jgi:enoyl-[acyl-carrier protein] reductase I